MRRSAISIVAVALATTACAGPGVLIAGEAGLNPEPPAPVVTVTVIAGDDMTPVPGAEVVVDSAAPTTTTDAGTFELEWQNTPIEIAASAPGFEAEAVSLVAYPEATDGAYQVVLDPLILEGTAVGPDGRPLPHTTVTLNGEEAVTDDQGVFTVTRALPGDITAARPAWEPATLAWGGEPGPVEIAMEPRQIYGLRVSGDKAANPTTWAEVLQLADESKINALIVDTKDETGWVSYETDIPTVTEIGALNTGHLYDVEQVIADMDAHGLYKITRVTTFQDNFLARAKPDIAIRDENTGDLWLNDKSIRWLDPTDRNSWEYPLDLAVNACEIGFDEIQFDYVRFPSDGNIQAVQTDGSYAEENRVATIRAFLEEAHSRLNPLGCAVAADIFAITLTSDWDEGIGQRPEAFADVIDVLSPMVYTYTYGAGWGGYANPNEQPVEIVSMAMDAGMEWLTGHAIYRPWIQTWQLNASQIVGVERAVEERNMGWMIWSANTQYDLSFLPND